MVIKGRNDVNIQNIKKLIDIFEKSEISELEVREENGASVRISRMLAAPVATYTAPIQVPTAHPHPMTPGMAFPEHKPVNASVSTVTATPAPAGHVLKAPMVGTFYRAPSPNDKPFVTIGQPVKPGDVLCLIEAMKMLNQIEADKAGVVQEILIEN